jgi:hypothetical protein
MIVKIVRERGDDGIIGVFSEHADLSAYSSGYEIDEFCVDGATDGLPNWMVLYNKKEVSYKVTRWFGPLSEPIDQTFVVYYYVSAKDQWAALKKVLES